MVVSGGKVFIGTNNENPRDPQHQGDRSILMCFDEKTGDFLWQLVVPKLASGKVNDWENLGLLSSPCVEGNRVYLVTSRCEVICLDTEGMANGQQRRPVHWTRPNTWPGPGNPPAKIGPHDADIIWRYDMMDELGVFPHNASNCSLLIVGDLHLRLHLQRPGLDARQHSLAQRPQLHRAQQEDRASWSAEDNAGIGPRIFHGQWSSPSDRRGQRQATDLLRRRRRHLLRLRRHPEKGNGAPIVPVVPGPPVNRFEDNDTDYLKKVWWFDCNPPERRANDAAHKYPAPGRPQRNQRHARLLAQPRLCGGRPGPRTRRRRRQHLLVLTPPKPATSPRPAKSGATTKSTAAFPPCRITPDGLLFVGDFSGFVHCLDAETGKLYWEHDMKSHMWGSTLVADGKVYCGDEDGDLVVFAASKEKKILSKINLGAPVYSTPVVANGVLYVHSNTHLFAFYNHDKTGAPSDQKQAHELRD